MQAFELTKFFFLVFDRVSRTAKTSILVIVGEYVNNFRLVFILNCLYKRSTVNNILNS